MRPGWRWSWWRLCWVPSAPPVGLSAATVATLNAIYTRYYTPSEERTADVVYAALRKDDAP